MNLSGRHAVVRIASTSDIEQAQAINYFEAACEHIYLPVSGSQLHKHEVISTRNKILS